MSPTADWQSGTGEATAEDQEAGEPQGQSAVVRSWQQNRGPLCKTPALARPRQGCRLDPPPTSVQAALLDSRGRCDSRGRRSQHLHGCF